MKQYKQILLHEYIVCLLVLFSACNTAKYIPPGEYLLDKVDIKMEDKGVDKSVLLPYIQQKPNVSKWGLGIYNLVKDDSNFIKKFIRKIGEPPVLFNNHSVLLSINELDMQMKNMGYLQATVSAQVDTANRKAVVNYLIRNDEPYRIRNYTIELPLLENRRQFPRATAPNVPRASSFPNAAPEVPSPRTQRDRRLIKEGAIFDLDLLEKERARLSSQLRNQGYYAFTQEDLHYLADTALHSRQVDLTMILTDTTQKMLPYRVQRVNVFSGYDPLAKEAYKITDSLEYNGLHIYYDNLHFLRQGIIRNKVQVQPGQLYRERQGRSTYDLFQVLGSVGRVNIQYDSAYPDSTLLDCNIYLTPGNNHSLQVGVGGTNKAGDFGLAVDATYGNQNIFNGSEIFNIRVRGAYEFVSGKIEDGALVHNYYELGLNPSLTFQQWRVPFIGNYMTDRYKAQVRYSLGYNIQRRPEYMRNFFNLKWQLQWSSQQDKFSQSVNVLDINYVNMPWQSDKFKQYLANNVDSLTKYSYDNVFTAGMGYSSIYTNAEVGRMRQNLYTIRFNVETSGNMLGWIFDAYYKNNRIIPAGAYDILGNPFAQYVKGDMDFAETFQLDENNGLAFHIGAGIAYPYKNSSILPFEKRYYGGGPNNVRGWRTRYLGPGSFQGRRGDPTTHVGDISLIVSAEYRLRILSWLEPAFFVDAGNIWTIKDYPDQPGGLFQWNRFYREIAVGTGIGLRFDFNYLILRFDVGTQIYDPALQRSVFLKDKFFNHSAMYMAIGYPF